MSKIVTIPADYRPWECEINGVHYAYPAGTEQEVPDEVAELIENNQDQSPKENDYKEAPDGYVWTYKNGVPEWAEPAGSGSSISDAVAYLTEAPTSANTDGLKFVILSSDPVTKYDGYIYITTGGQNDA